MGIVQDIPCPNFLVFLIFIVKDLLQATEYASEQRVMHTFVPPLTHLLFCIVGLLLSTSKLENETLVLCCENWVNW